MKPKISVIIPVYNVEKYLSVCLNSVLESTFSDYEIILVYGNSTDSSTKIALEFAKNNKKIKAYKQKNKGLQEARNIGIRKSNGEYIVFIDSDDYVSKDYLEKLYKAITDSDADIAVCGFRRVDAISGKCYSEEMTQSRNILYPEKDTGLLAEINVAVWNKIYKTTLIKTMPKIKSSPKIMEDVIFSNLLFCCANKIVFVPESLYFYTVRKDSLVNNINLEIANEAKIALEEIREAYTKKGQTFLDYIDAEAFLHFGISLMYRLYASKTPDFNKILKENTKYLNEKFPGWKKNRYISLKYVLSNKGSNAKLWIVRQFYKIPGGFRFFLFCYTLMIDKLKVDIKW